MIKNKTPKVSENSELFKIVSALADEGGKPVVVGGWVRDSLLGLPQSPDYDLEVFGLPPKKLKKLLSNFGPVHVVGRQFGVLKLQGAEAEFDVSVPRRESKTGKGHKGFWIGTDPWMTFEEASARRDFTINAMGFDVLEKKLLDPHGGMVDLNNQMIRHVGPAFGEDPLRVLRAMQFAGRFGFSIHPETLAICQEQDLTELPRERLWEEFKKLLLKAEKPSQGLKYMKDLAVLPYFPEFLLLEEAVDTEGKSLWQAGFNVLDELGKERHGEAEKDLPLMCAGLCEGFFHLDDPENGIKRSEEVLARLTNETVVLKAVKALLENREAPGKIAKSPPKEQAGAIRRLALALPLYQLIKFSGAIARARGRDTSPGERLLEQAKELGVSDGPPEPLLLGRHLKTLNFSPGPEMGKILSEAFEKQLDGEFKTLDQALDWAKGKLP